MQGFHQTTEHAVRDFTALQKGVRHTERITADLQRQLDWLLRPHFLWAHGAERLDLNIQGK